MKKLYSSILLGLLLSSMLILGACNNNNDTKASDPPQSDSHSSGTVTSLPIAVKEGHVSESVYLEIIRYLSKEDGYYSKMMENVDRVGADNDLLDDASFIKEFNTLLNEYEVHLKGFHTNPKTEIDLELSNYLSEIILDEQRVVQSLRKGLADDLAYHSQRAAEHNNDLSVSIGVLANAMEKHNLLKE